MKALLVRPDSLSLHLDASPGASRFGERNQPLGLLYLGTTLRRAGHEVMIADEVAGDDVEDAIERFGGGGLVGITVSSPLVGRAAQFVRAAARVGALAVVGGPHVSALPRESLMATGADIAVVGEGEKTLEEIASGTPLADVSGIAFKRNGSIHLNPPRQPEPRLDSIPFPDRSLIDIRKYEGDEEFGLPMPRGRTLFRVLASRGCPYGCTFCGCATVFGRNLRHRSPANLVEEIGHLVRSHGARTFFFVDDTFAAVPDRTVSSCEAIRKSGLPVDWGCYARVDTPDDLLAAMRSAGCRFIGFGVESGSPRLLERVCKNTSIASIERAFSTSRRLGIRTKAFFMVGLPGETDEDFRESLRLARRIDPDYLWVSVFTPLPGTAAFHETFDGGKNEGYDHENRSYFHTRDPVLLARHRGFVRAFYLRPRFVWSLLGRRPRMASLSYAIRMAKAYLGMDRHRARTGGAAGSMSRLRGNEVASR